MFDWAVKAKLKEPLLEQEAVKVVSSNRSGSIILTSGDQPGPKRLTAAERVQRYLEASAASTDTVNPALSKFLRLASPLLTSIVSLVVFVSPFYVWLYSKAYELYRMAPTNVLQLVFGAALCFFGGTFSASIAAIEAFRHMGWQRCLADVNFLVAEASLVSEVSARVDGIVGSFGIKM